MLKWGVYFWEGRREMTWEGVVVRNEPIIEAEARPNQQIAFIISSAHFSVK